MYTIGQLAGIAGISTKALRIYEKRDYWNQYGIPKTHTANTEKRQSLRCKKS